MPNQMGFLREPFVAKLAEERLLTCMHQHMLIQLTLRRERLSTLITMIVFLARVYFYVSV